MDYRLAELTARRNSALRELAELNTAIDARVAELLKAYEQGTQEAPLTKANLRAYADSLGTPPHTTSRAWVLLNSSIAEHLGAIHPELDIRSGNDGMIDRARLFSARNYLRPKMVRDYGPTHHLVITSWIAYLMRGANTPLTLATRESLEEFATRHNSSVSAASLAHRLLLSKEMRLHLFPHGVKIILTQSEITLECLIVAKPHLTEGCVSGFGAALAQLVTRWIESLERA